MIGYLVSFMLTFVLIGVFGFIVFGLTHLVFSNMGAV
jgi:hypothetical protein